MKRDGELMLIPFNLDDIVRRLEVERWPWDIDEYPSEALKDLWKINHT